MTNKTLFALVVALFLAAGFGGWFMGYQAKQSGQKLGGVYGVSAFNDYTDATLATTTLATYPGILHTIVVGTPVANSVITVCDSATSSSCAKVVATITIPSSAPAPFELTFDNIFASGLTVAQSGATSTLTAEYQQN